MAVAEKKKNPLAGGLLAIYKFMRVSATAGDGRGIVEAAGVCMAGHEGLWWGGGCRNGGHMYMYK